MSSATLEAPETRAQFASIPLSSIEESKTNPRTHFNENAMIELAESIKSGGVRQPVLLRPLDDQGRYELVAGTRRFRASQLAELEEIPAIISQLTDAEAIEIQVVENLQREDVHELEEAVGYRQMLATEPYASMEATERMNVLAAKVGKSTSYIYQRLKLLDLAPKLQEAFFEGDITAGHAILIARLDPKEQLLALKACHKENYYGSIDNAKGEKIMSVRALRDWLKQKHYLAMSTAPFDRENLTLLPQAGSCAECPKRTGYKPEFFPEFNEEDICTDRKCFDQKVAAHIEAVKARLVAEGKAFIEISTLWDTKLPNVLPQGKWSPAEEEDEEEPIEGVTIELGLVVEGRDLGRVLNIIREREDEDDEEGAERGSLAQRHAERMKADREREKARREIAQQLALELVPLMEQDPFSADDMRFIAKSVLLRVENPAPMLARRGWIENEDEYDYNIKDFENRIDQLNFAELRGFLVESIFCDEIFDPYGQPDLPSIVALAKSHGINTDAVNADLLVEEEEEDDELDDELIDEESDNEELQPSAPEIAPEEIEAAGETLDPATGGG
jgi:ParB family chromosome partitioning protein